MLEKDYKLERSDKLTVRGVVQEGFGNYAAFMYRPAVISISRPIIPDYALKVRDIFTKNVQESLDDNEQSGLALSYLTGQKTLLSEEQKRKLRLVGLAHVVVASGYHLSTIVGLAKKMFKKISRFAIFIGSTIMLVAYVSVTGFSPSMARAGLMTFLALWAWYYGRRFHPLRLVLYVAAISLLIYPSYISNLAWQLSFSSYCGIIFLSPTITKFFYGDNKPGYVAGLLIVSFSAQLLCLPITIYSFGEVPLLALVANLLVTPAVPYVMLLTFLLGITRLALFVPLASLLLSFQIHIINTIAAIPWSGFSIPAGNHLVFLLYVPIFVVMAILKRSTRYSFRPSYAKIRP